MDWLFTERADRFAEYWLHDSLGASLHWYTFMNMRAVQRGSIHRHVVAKLKNDPRLCVLTELAIYAKLRISLRAVVLRPLLE